MRWTQQLWRIAKSVGGLSPSNTRQLYSTVALPALTYMSDVWYIPLFKLPHARKSAGSARTTKLLHLIQGAATRHITGGLRGMAFNTLEVHANLPPVDLLFQKSQFWATSRITALPACHPLFPIAQMAAACFMKSHRSPLHYLFFTTGIKPQLIETIASMDHCSPTYIPVFKTTISEDKVKVLQHAGIVHDLMRYKVYCNSSGFQEGAGAAAVLYKGNRAVKTLQLHAGSMTEHTVYKMELIGIILTFHLLTLLACQLTSSSVVIGLNNQARIKFLSNQKAKPAHYLLDQIHMAAELLHAKQDQLQCKLAVQQARHKGQHLPVKTRGVCDIQIHWVPGHTNFEPNEKANEATKHAALGESSPTKDLSAFLCKPIPLGISALQQEAQAKTQQRWKRHWKTSP